VLGLQAGSYGSLQVSESSSFTSTSRLDVGDAGNGVFAVWSSSQATVAGVSIARMPGSIGSLSVNAGVA
jgi:T5SS/PEP-CTERM-associated repeat protein